MYVVTVTKRTTVSYMTDRPHYACKCTKSKIFMGKTTGVGFPAGARIASLPPCSHCHLMPR